MGFSAPIWLFGLAPWGVWALWLLWGRRPRAPVPFLPLWHGPAEHAHIVWKMQPPPVSIILAIIAVLLAILGAAGPMVHGKFTAGRGGLVTVIVDRGFSMSEPGADGEARFVQAAERAAGAMHDALDDAPMEIVAVPAHGEAREAGAGDWVGMVRGLGRTGVDSGSEVRSVAARAIAGGSGPVVVFSDRGGFVDDPRLIVVPPAEEPKSVLIMGIGARITHDQAGEIMVRIRNGTDAKSGALVVRGGEEGRLEIELPPEGEERDYFVDLAKLGNAIEADVEVGGHSSLGQRAFLTRDALWPRLEARGTIEPELRRLMDAYGKLQPAGDGSKVVYIATSNSGLGSSQGAVIAPGADDVTRTALAWRSAADWHVEAHPVIEGISNWEDIARDPTASVAALPDGVGWHPILSVGGKALIAVRENPGRQVWIGLDSSTWPRSVAYVEFWKNAFDWVGRGGDAYSSMSAGRLGSEWSRREGSPVMEGDASPGLLPGIYQRGDGALRAINCGVGEKRSTVETDWARRLAEWKFSDRYSLPVHSWFVLAAMACVLGSAVFWRRRRAGFDLQSVAAGGAGI